ncbi:hypothetical protein C7477_11180 [Phyllobacterium leguminum]|uniref:Uncharacterized protein n=1 Tax=Phyllobacterium leguminum TaxID=314237 RepID=A0A318T0E8_9HYPH|nr:hypothetical protein C7477_11180 [Phyllobacterium leguminum]
MDLDRILHGRKISFRKCSQLVFEARFVCRRDLVGHGFAALSADRYYGFSRINSPCVARQGHDDHTGQMSVRRVVADDNCRA